jgi:hypothetical protein
LRGANTELSDFFDVSVTIFGDTIVIGATGEDLATSVFVDRCVPGEPVNHDSQPEEPDANTEIATS